jgi:hypothetical protein
MPRPPSMTSAPCWSRTSWTRPPSSSLPVGSGLSTQDLPPAQQGRIPACATPRPPVRARGHDPRSPARGTDRASLVSDLGHERGNRVDHRVLRARRRADAAVRAAHRRRGPGAHLPSAQREHQLLRRDRGRCRCRTCPARSHRVQAATRARHPLLTGAPGRAPSMTDQPWSITCSVRANGSGQWQVRREPSTNDKTVGLPWRVIRAPRICRTLEHARTSTAGDPFALKIGHVRLIATVGVAENSQDLYRFPLLGGR